MKSPNSPKPQITESMLKSHSTAQSFDRGQDYYRSEAVVEIIQRGGVLQALVEGSEYEPYCVQLTIDAGGIRQATCTCQYDYEGWCKHIIAVGLTCIHNSEQIETGRTIEEILEPFNLEQVKQLVVELVKDDPQIINNIELITIQLEARPTQATTQKASQQRSSQTAEPLAKKSAGRTRTRKTTIDPKPFATQVRYLVRNTVNHWEEGGEENLLMEELPELIQSALEFSDRGDGESASIILEAITTEICRGWDDLSDYGGDAQEVLQVLDPAWAAVILTSELSEQERIDRQVQLEEWADELNAEFSLGSAALREGWDDERLQAVLAGESTDLWGEERPDYADDLAQVRLAILDQQGRTVEYLRLAEAEQQIRSAMEMLIECDRISEAMAMVDRLPTIDDAFEVAKCLRQQEAIPEALQVAEWGLTLPKYTSDRWQTFMLDASSPSDAPYFRYEVAQWASELAEGLGDKAKALELRVAAFKAKPNLADYQALKTLAGKQWKSLQPELLAHLRQLNIWFEAAAKVRIFLQEGLVEDAIAVVDHYHDHDLMLQVMQAATTSHPDWVIQLGKKYAEEIMDRGKADRYDRAAKYLKQVQTAYLQSDQQASWTKYRDQLVTQHGRKRKLMGCMQAVGLL
ncbi:SWIM zinc finger family protein [Alkalinema pantanalense CENA528]|uniref:SWIM zinc finger family protein n=1 Tax=Alkalinema pantanalense TaxID=1620705 RepID=UPI003D6E7BEE